MYSFWGQTCWLADKWYSLISDKSPLDRSLTSKWYRAVKIRGNSLRHISLSISQGPGRETSDRPPPIRWNNSAYSIALRWFLNEPAPFDCGLESAPNLLVNYHKMLPVTASVPLRCAATRHWSIYSIGWSVLDACGSEQHCMNPDRQCHLAKAPVCRFRKWKRRTTINTTRQKFKFQTKHKQQIIYCEYWITRKSKQTFKSKQNRKIVYYTYALKWIGNLTQYFLVFFTSMVKIYKKEQENTFPSAEFRTDANKLGYLCRIWFWTWSNYHTQRDTHSYSHEVYICTDLFVSRFL